MGIIMENFIYDVAVFTVTILVIFISYMKWKFTYWQRKGIKNILPPRIPFGNATNLFTKKTNLGETFRDLYFELRKKDYEHGFLYFTASPTYIPTNPEIIKCILQKDFAHFMNHGTIVCEEIDPLSGHLFNLEDEKWKNLRVKLTPTFTSGKMKMMFQTLVDCTKGLTKILENHAQQREAMEIKDVFGRFTTDIIGSVAFGLECNSLEDPNAIFRVEGRRVFKLNYWDSIKNSLPFVFPLGILKLLRLRITKQETEDFFMDVIKKTVEYREKNNIIRNDFMHLLLQLKNRGELTDDGKILNDNGIKMEGITFNELAAQCFVFFIAGYETSSTASTFVLYELAKNQEVQQNARDEIKKVLNKHDGKITYEAIMEMTYLDKIINESLRKHPPIAFLPRMCNKDYKIPNTDLVLEKGTFVCISVMGMHYDPEYYPNPEKFDPERFSEKAKHSRPPFTWLPFGEGPRVCIGLRFGMMQSKVGLATVLEKYKLTLNKKTIEPLVLEKTGIVTTAQGGVWLNVEKI